MAIPKVSLFVPLVGELDTKKAPLSIPSTSLLTCDNVVQERKGEFRRRNGFTQVAADTLASPMFTGPFMTAPLGTSGMFAGNWQASQAYDPTASLAAARWKTDNTSAFPVLTPGSGAEDLARQALAFTFLSTAKLNGFASDGASHVATVIPSAGAITSVDVVAYDEAGNMLQSGCITAGANTPKYARCAAGKNGATTVMCAFVSDGAGNLYVMRYTDGSITAQSTIKTGLTAGGLFDCMYYTGTSVTIVAAMAAGGFQFMEYNVSSLTLTTDVNIALSAAITVLSCVMEPSGSGVRSIMTSDSTTATTRIYRITSAGAVTTNNTIEAITSSQGTGCMTNSGADGSFAYQNQATGMIRRASLIGGVIFGLQNMSGIVTQSSTPVILAGQGWGEPADTRWFFLLAANSPLTGSDPQLTITMAVTGFGSSPYCQPISAVVPLQGPQIPASYALIQAQRTGTRSFYFGMPVLTKYEPTLGAGAAWAEYTMTAFDHTILSSAEIGTVNIGSPCNRGQVTFLPLNALRYLDQALAQIANNPNLTSSPIALPVGTFQPPKRPVSVTPATGAGGLTLLATYQWCWQLDIVNVYGQTWRSAPSVPFTLTLTGTQNQVTVVFSPWQNESEFQSVRLKLFRTDANGSVLRLVSIQDMNWNLLTVGGDITIADTYADSAIDANEILYTTGEQPNICWPPSSHCWIFDDRLWSVNRDFRSEVQYSKSLQAQRQPETTLANVVDLDDQWGDITNGSSVEGRGVVFKRNAIYFIQGDGLTDAGSGNNYTATRISDDIGSLPGTPIVNAGDAIYFVSQRGIYSVDAQGKITFVGGALDAWFNQPQVNTVEQVFDGIFVPKRNEVRFVTTNYVFVYDRNFPDANGLGQWSRWTSSALVGMRQCVLANDLMILFKNDGTVWREGDTTQTTDQGTAFTGVVRTAWIRYQATGAMPAAPTQAPLRFYNGRIVLTRTTGGGSITATGKVYFNDDDSQVQTFTSQAIAGATLTDVGEFFPTQQKCTSFSLEVDLPSGDNTLRVEGFAANIGLRVPSEQRRPAGEKWS